MPWFEHVPIVFWCVLALVFELLIGSFLNVLIVRLPYEKSVVWPSSRYFATQART